MTNETLGKYGDIGVIHRIDREMREHIFPRKRGKIGFYHNFIAFRKNIPEISSIRSLNKY